MNCEISLRSHLNAHCLAKPAGYVNICASIWAGEGKIDSSSQDLKKACLMWLTQQQSLQGAKKTITVKY